MTSHGRAALAEARRARPSARSTRASYLPGACAAGAPRPRSVAMRASEDTGASALVFARAFLLRHPLALALAVDLIKPCPP